MSPFRTLLAAAVFALPVAALVAPPAAMAETTTQTQTKSKKHASKSTKTQKSAHKSTKTKKQPTAS